MENNYLSLNTCPAINNAAPDEERELAILFLDIRNFTGLMESQLEQTVITVFRRLFFSVFFCAYTIGNSATQLSANIHLLWQNQLHYHTYDARQNNFLRGRTLFILFFLLMQSPAYSSVLAADGVINDKNSKKISLTTKKLSVCYQLEITSTG